MLRQLDIFETHSFENNPESQETLEIKKTEFEGQNRKLFDLLMTGKRITFSEAFITHGISDIRRRAKDLTDVKGVLLSKGFIPGTRTKEWWMDEDQIKHNRKFL